MELNGVSIVEGSGWFVHMIGERVHLEWSVDALGLGVKVHLEQLMDAFRLALAS